MDLNKEVYRSMLSTNFGSDNTHLLSTAEQYGHQLVRVEVALFAVPIEERFTDQGVVCNIVMQAAWVPASCTIKYVTKSFLNRHSKKSNFHTD